MQRQTEKRLLALSAAIGDFIRYWGFRRIHGQIWTQVYLSLEPLSGAELTRRLKVSKALVSPALRELIKYKLIYVHDDDGKTKHYAANPDVLAVIQHILAHRELKLMDRARLAYKKLDTGVDSSLNSARLKSLHEMIEVALSAGAFIVSQADESKFKNIGRLQRGWYREVYVIICTELFHFPLELKLWRLD